MPCNEEMCMYCSVAKRNHRKFLRKLASKDTKWLKLDNKMRIKYIEAWCSQNSLNDDV